MGGYMSESAVISWISLNYFIEYEKANEALDILKQQDLLKSSYNGGSVSD